MTRTSAIIALVLGLSGAGFSATAGLAQAAKAEQMRPPASFTGQWFTAPNGCSYSRAQAPGHPPSWHLILNPHHIGKPGARSSCPVML